MTKPALATVVSLALFGCPATTSEPQKQPADAKSESKAEAKTPAASDTKDGKGITQAITKATTPPNGPDAKVAPRQPPRGTQVPAPADVAAPPADAIKTESGIAYKVLSPGKGEPPSLNDNVNVQLTAWTPDGTTIETSQGRKTPKVIRMNRPPVPGLAEAIALMHLSEKTRFWIPQELTYNGRKGAPEGTLCYEIEVEEITRAPEVPSDVAAPPADATKTASGLAYKVLTKGTGDVKPRAWDKVEVHYSGWHTDGKMFDSSVTRGRPTTFPVNRVVKGWTEGLQLMVVGEKTRFWLPEELAYKGSPGKPQGMLVFDVELLKVEQLPEPPPPPETPADVAAVPDDATKTASGLAYRVLTKGTGSDHPAATSMVKVHYSGWTTDGKMFDSSVTRGKPSQFPLNGVIKGWTEGLQLMVAGEKTRFWIPVEMAYQNRPGKPAGMLVFDVELIEIVKK